MQPKVMQFLLWSKEIRTCSVLLGCLGKLACLWQSLLNTFFLWSQTFECFSWCNFSPKFVLKAGPEHLFAYSTTGCTLFLFLLTVFFNVIDLLCHFFLVHHHGSKMLRSESNSSITTTQPTIGWQPLSLPLPSYLFSPLLLHSCFNYLF